MVPLFSTAGLERINRAVVSGRILPFLVGATALVTLAAALVVEVFAHGEFDSFGESVWWAAQTVTTVGYGDVIPQTAFSKSVAVFVMFFGIAAVSLVTAVVTSAVMASSQRRFVTERGTEGRASRRARADRGAPRVDRAATLPSGMPRSARRR